VIESITANAQPSGITIRAVHEALRDTILADLTAAGPVEMVLLNLQGAMVVRARTTAKAISSRAPAPRSAPTPSSVSNSTCIATSMIGCGPTPTSSCPARNIRIST